MEALENLPALLSQKVRVSQGENSRYVWLSLAEEALPGVGTVYVVALLVLMYFDDFLSVPLVPRFLHILFAFLLKNRSYHMLLQLEC